MLLHIWSGCGGLLNEVAVADMKRSRRGDAPDAKPFGCSNAVASIGRGTACTARQSWTVGGCMIVVQTAFGRVVECGRVKCA